MFNRMLILTITTTLLLMSSSFLQADTITYDFSDPNQLNDWTQIDDGNFEIANPPPLTSLWAVAEGALHQTQNNIRCDPVPCGPGGEDPRGGGYMLLTTPGSVNWSNYKLSADLKWDDDDIWGLMVYYTDELNYYRFNIIQPGHVGLDMFVDGKYTELVQTQPPTPELDVEIVIAGDFVRCSIAIQDGQFTCSVDEQEIPDLAITDTSLTHGSVGLHQYSNTGQIDNVTIEGDTVAVEPGGKLAMTWGQIKSLR